MASRLISGRSVALAALIGSAIAGCTQMVVSRPYPRQMPTECRGFLNTKQACDSTSCPDATSPKGVSAPSCSAIDQLGSEKTGITYYLPKRQVKLRVVRAPLDLKQLKKDAADARNEADTLKRAAKSAADKRELAAAIAARTTGDGAAIAKQNADLAAGEAAEAKKRAEDTEAAAQKLEGKVRLAQAVPVQFDDTVSIELLDPEPDTSQAFIAQLDHSPLHEDELNLATTQNGLLSTVKAVGIDRTPDIILELAKTAVQAARLAGMFAMGTEAEAGQPLKPFSYEVIFDPTEAGDVQRVNDTLKDALHTAYKIGVAPSPTTPPQDAQWPFGTEVAGLLYRRPAQYTIAFCEALPPQDTTITLSARPSSCGLGFRELNSAAVQLPNKGDIAVLPFETGAFVTTTYDVEFKDGSLMHAYAKRPSEVWGVVQIIPNVLKEIASIPTELIQLKIDYSTKENDLLKNQTAILKEMQNVIEERRNLQDLQKPPASTQASDGSGS